MTNTATRCRHLWQSASDNDTVEAGEVFGVLKCIYGTDNRLYSARAKTDSSLLFIPKGLLIKKLEATDPFILYCIRNGR